MFFSGVLVSLTSFVLHLREYRDQDKDLLLKKSLVSNASTSELFFCEVTAELGWHRCIPWRRVSSSPSVHIHGRVIVNSKQASIDVIVRDVFLLDGWWTQWDAFALSHTLPFRAITYRPPPDIVLPLPSRTDWNVTQEKPWWNLLANCKFPLFIGLFYRNRILLLVTGEEYKSMNYIRYRSGFTAQMWSLKTGQLFSSFKLVNHQKIIMFSF